jgi:hypothetical protein
MLLVQTLEQIGIPWCMIGGLAANHWVIEPMATADVDVVIDTEKVEHAVSALEKVGSKSKRFDWSINLAGVSSVSIQISTEAVYAGFPERSLAASVHGILMRVASLQDALKGKLLAWQDKSQRPSKRQKDLMDITRSVENHPELAESLPSEVADRIAQI